MFELTKNGIRINVYLGWLDSVWNYCINHAWDYCIYGLPIVLVFIFYRILRNIKQTREKEQKIQEKKIFPGPWLDLYRNLKKSRNSTEQECLLRSFVDTKTKTKTKIPSISHKTIGMIYDTMFKSRRERDYYLSKSSREIDYYLSLLKPFVEWNNCVEPEPEQKNGKNEILGEFYASKVEFPGIWSNLLKDLIKIALSPKRDESDIISSIKKYKENFNVDRDCKLPTKTFEYLKWLFNESSEISNTLSGLKTFCDNERTNEA